MGEAEELLNGCGLVLPAACWCYENIPASSDFKSGTSDTPYNVTSHQRKVGTEIKCDCPMYCSTPHIICQHALAAAEDIGILGLNTCNGFAKQEVLNLLPVKFLMMQGRSQNLAARELLERKNHRKMILISSHQHLACLFQLMLGLFLKL